MRRILASLAQSTYRVLFDHRPLPEPEPVNSKPRPMVGFFAMLSDEEKRAALAYRGPENHGTEELRRSAV